MNNSVPEALVCFLIVNKIRFLPNVVIQSVLQNTEANILVGYINIEDLIEIPKSSRIKFVDLGAHKNSNLSAKSNYVDFETEEFFQVVQLKWVLLKYALSSFDASTIIYSDLDCLWLRDASKNIIELFDEKEEIVLAIQNNTFDTFKRYLCMGFFAIRNSQENFELIELLSKNHKIEIQNNRYFGDDDVITNYYEAERWPNSFFLLSQVLYPTGNLSNLLFRPSYFMEVYPPTPYVLHANYVVGNFRKNLLIYKVAKHYGIIVENISIFFRVKMELVNFLIKSFFKSKNFIRRFILGRKYL